MPKHEKELTIKDVAKQLGVSTRTVYHRIAAGALEARLEGNEYRISRTALNAYIQSTYQKARERRGKDGQTDP